MATAATGLQLSGMQILLIQVALIGLVVIKFIPRMFLRKKSKQLTGQNVNINRNDE